EEMKSCAVEFLLENHKSDISHFRLGFHRPPFNSVHHLHLHVIGPLRYSVHEIMFNPRMGIFIPKTQRKITFEEPNGNFEYHEFVAQTNARLLYQVPTFNQETYYECIERIRTLQRTIPNLSSTFPIPVVCILVRLLIIFRKYALIEGKWTGHHVKYVVLLDYDKAAQQRGLLTVWYSIII
ncbi:type V p-type ATPase isoform, partial [Clonorchis sinensis]